MDDRHTRRPLADQRDDRGHRWAHPWLDAELTPLRMSLAYLVLGLGALYVSDVVFVRYLTDPLLSRIQAIKGGVEVFLTAGFVFLLTARREAQQQQHIDRLDQQHEQLQVLHRVLRHNLRNDLNVIQGYTKRLLERLETTQRDSECEKILETAEQMERYTEQATRIKRITEGEDLLQSYDLTELIPRLVDHPRVTDDVAVSVSVPDSATVVANRMFEAALREVVTNAIKHNDSETPRIAITVLPAAGPSHVIEIQVSDNGPGIPDGELKPLQEGKEEPVVHLSGLGLWFVAWTIRQSDGTLDFEGNEEGGTTVRIQVPRAPGESSSLVSLFPALEK
jgi:signal transduction histidine kinase